MKHLVVLLVVLTIALGAFGQRNNATNGTQNVGYTRDGRLFRICPVEGNGNGTQNSNATYWVCHPADGRGETHKPRRWFRWWFW